LISGAIEKWWSPKRNGVKREFHLIREMRAYGYEEINDIEGRKKNCWCDVPEKSRRK
jgi:hypothetical protein